MTGACVYCDSKDIRERYVYSDGLIAVFPTNIPIVPMPLLVVPLRHVQTISELNQSELVALFVALEKMKSLLRSKCGAEGFNVAWDEGKLAGQSVPHLHIHVLPRKEGDTGVTEYDPRKFLYRPGSREATPEAELRAVVAELRAALSV